MIEFDNLTYLHGKPQGTGLLKANPEDFVVVEDLGFEPDGEGIFWLESSKMAAIPVLWRMHWRNSLKFMPVKSASLGKKTNML